MKKRNLLFLLVLLSVFTLVLTGCGGGSNEKPAEPAAQEVEAPAAADAAPAEEDVPEGAEGKVVIKYWNTNRHDMAYMEPMIAKFNEENEKIFIDYQIYPDNYSQMIDLAFSTNSAPDVFQALDMAVSYDKGYLMDLTPFFTDEYKARWGEGAFVEGVNMMDGKIYTAPYTMSVVRLFYNKDIFERVGLTAPPKTIDELVEYATKISDELSSEGIYGFAANYKSSLSSVMRTIDVIVQKSGGTRSGFDFKTGTYDFSSYEPVIEGFKKIFTSKAAFPGSESLDIDPLRTQFAAGKIGMYMSVSHAEPGVYRTQFPTDVNWDVAEIPTVTGEVDGLQQLWFGGFGFHISSQTKHPEEAWEVFKYLYSDEVMSGYQSEGLGVVMIKSAAEKAEVSADFEKWPALAPQDYDRNWPALPINVVVEGKDYSAVVVEAIFGVTPIDKAIEDLNKRYNAAYDKLVEGGVERRVYPNFDPLNQDLSK